MLNLEDLCDSDLEDQLDDNKVADDESAANEAETAVGDILLKSLEKNIFPATKSQKAHSCG